jgi:rubrerythrin
MSFQYNHAPIREETSREEKHMDRKNETEYACQVCGSEADLIIEGFDTVSEAIKAGTMVCKTCGNTDDIVLTEEPDETVKAVTLAVKREKEAYLFYTAAAQRTSSERGRDMFNQLAAFELNHYKKMIHLYHSLKKSGRWVPYGGQEDIKASRHIREHQGHKEADQDDIDALTMAIKKEEDAEALYRRMAEMTEDPTGKEMLERLAGEEEVHRRILNDQFYSLSNRGLWVWAE